MSAAFTPAGVGRVGSAETGSRASMEPASSLHPSGFDPARINFDALEEHLEREMGLAEPLLRRWNVSWQKRGNGYRLVGFVVPDADALLWNKSLWALAELAKAAPKLLAELRRAAQAANNQARGQ